MTSHKYDDGALSEALDAVRDNPGKQFRGVSEDTSAEVPDALLRPMVVAIREEMIRLRGQLRDDVRAEFRSCLADPLFSPVLGSTPSTADLQNPDSAAGYEWKTPQVWSTSSKLTKIHKELNEEEEETRVVPAPKKKMLKRSMTSGDIGAAASLQSSEPKANRLQPMALPGQVGDNSRSNSKQSNPPGGQVAVQLGKGQPQDGDTKEDFDPADGVESDVGAHPSTIISGVSRRRASQDGVMDEFESTWHRRLYGVLRSTRFEIITIVMILLNAIQVGALTDTMARGTLRDTPMEYRVLEIIFMLYFTAEVALKMFVFRSKFWNMPTWGWNVLDLALVALQILEELLTVAISSGGALENSPGFLLRCLRVLRSIRVIRVLRLTSATADLRLLVSCLIHSARPFIWSAVLIFLMVYIVGIYFTQIVLMERVHGNIPADIDEILVAKFGNVPAAALSLFEGLTGGVDWHELSDPLIKHISPWLGVVFVIYTAFAIIAVMNVITGTFVENAIQKAMELREVQRVLLARKLFKQLDADGSGKLSLDELQSAMDNEQVQEYFRTIDVETAEANFLFEMLDSNKSGSIDFDEFLNGCLRLQNPAKALDLLLMTKETRGAFDRQSRMLSAINTRSAALLDDGGKGVSKSKAPPDDKM